MNRLVRLLRRLPFGEGLIERFKQARTARRARLQARYARSRSAVRRYYALRDDAFSDEQYAVLTGIAARKRTEYRAVGASYDLRRAIHRLEKGLIMRPRRPVFATSYIREAVASLALVSSAGRDGDEVRWAVGVLSEYFAVVPEGLDDRVDEARTSFCAVAAGANAERSSDGIPRHPYPRGELTPAVLPEALMALIKQRRSVRWFLPDRVPRELIDQALLAAREAPSACNRLPYRYIVVDKDPLRSQVADIPGGTKGFAHNFPVIIAVVGELHAFEFERDRHLIYIDSSLSVMQFLLALQAQGVSSCVINWPDRPQKHLEVQPLLGLRNDERVVMMIAAGFADPDGLVPSSIKKPLSRIREYRAK